MKKKARFFIFVFILLAACGAAFYAGFAAFRVSDGQYGVLVSKTSGVSETPVEPGVFSWRWELLIPTNARIVTFSSEPFKTQVVKSGKLPSGDVYAKMLSENPDFSYSFTCGIELKCDGDSCVRFVKENGAASDSALRKKMEDTAAEIAGKVESGFLSQIQNTGTVDFDALKNSVKASYATSIFSISSLEISSVRIPDADLYRSVKKMYMDYIALVNSSLQSMAESQARDISEYTKNLNKLDRFGKVLKENPELSDLLKTSKDLNETLKAFFSL